MKVVKATKHPKPDHSGRAQVSLPSDEPPLDRVALMERVQTEQDHDPGAVLAPEPIDPKPESQVDKFRVKFGMPPYGHKPKKSK